MVGDQAVEHFSTSTAGRAEIAIRRGAWRVAAKGVFTPNQALLMRRGIHTAVLCLCALGIADGFAQDAPGRVSERSVKAAFLYKFAIVGEGPAATAGCA